jgi:hypothetical protein
VAEGLEPGDQAAGFPFGVLAAGEVVSAELRDAALSRLAPHLMVLLEGKDSFETQEEWTGRRWDVLYVLAPYLSHDQLPDALDDALDLLSREPNWPVLASLAGPLATLPRDRLHPLWRQILHSLAALHRTEALFHLRSLGPLMTTLGEQAAAAKFARAIDDTGDWWP